MKQGDLPFRLCVMLAFQSMITHGKKTDTKDSAQKIIELAKHMNEFCDFHLPEAFPPTTISFVDDTGAAKIDEAINLHIEELRKQETTRLPEDKGSLIQFYDRLMQRKSRRTQMLFYANATKEKLADLVLRYLDEEIEDTTVGALQ